MKKKIFRAQSIQQAVTQVKEALGEDAMILSTRKLPRSVSSPYTRQMFEVEAAVSDSSSQVKKDILEKAVSRDQSADGYGGIKEELLSIKDLISLVGLGSGFQNMICAYPGTQALFASLLRSGVSEQMVTFVLQNALYAMDKDKIPETDKGAVLKKYVLRQFVRQIETKDFFDLPSDPGHPHVAAFVGPTGVGKTTTIAKLAAELSLKRKKKVGLVSIDNYRIGAYEQLKAYASIMGLMSVSAFTRKDLETALLNMSRMDMVLIDTAGHSHSDNVRMNEATQMINGNFNMSVHLVLSVTTDFVDMKQAARAFSSLKPDSYVFTKIDEARRCGKILDQISQMKLPVSIVTNGQKVPEDLIVPDVSTMLGIVLGTET
ncbi:MAG: protein FlhF [Thermodesulfobacteriota bacterium]|nr:protein FlhF [Thermodesulfobacteriota bacterium]